MTRHGDKNGAIPSDDDDGGGDGGGGDDAGFRIKLIMFLIII